MKRHALLVGVEEYRDQMISRLQFARADATALADRLHSRCGFDQVRVLAGDGGSDAPDLVNIVTALRDSAGELREDDLFLFFFAGHGVEKDGHGYLLARDSLHAYPEHGSLSLELLRKNFERLNSSKRLLLLDACRNSPDVGRGDADNRMGDVISRDIVAAARSKLSGGTTTSLLSACRSGQRAYEWPAKGHGVFTQYLIEGLDGAAWTDRELAFERLAGFAAKQVRQWSANTPGLPIPQEPWYEKFGDPEPVLLAVGKPQGASASARPIRKTQDVQAKPTARWWVVIDGQEKGPLDEVAVRDAIKQENVTQETDCWRDGMDGWRPLGETDEWADALPSKHKAPPAGKPPKREPSVTIPDFLEPVPDAPYAQVDVELNFGSKAAQKHQMEWVQKGYPLEVKIKRTGMGLRLIPPGEFLMGSKGDSQASDDEKPQHRVTIGSPMYVGKFPITQKQWQAIMGRNPARFQSGVVMEAGGFFKREKRLKVETKEHPVDSVSWDDCQEFLHRVYEELDVGFGKVIRLLTEAQWEYACRAGTSKSRYGNLDAIGWYGRNAGGMTHPVGKKRPNAWGLHDMIGNVYEWCEDAWHANYTEAPADGSAWQSGSDRVLRGSWWYDNPACCRSARRYKNAPGYRNHTVGVRVVVDLGTSEIEGSPNPFPAQGGGA